ncbi:MAG TPA: DUF4625 domain-containing protein [Cyclobacteriaceae bacterium]|nr:DUF4625 domain-containing protein [Cyclobacteriaceae bacterium]
MKFLRNIILLILMVLVSCNDQEHLTIDKKPPEIEILSPERNTIYSQGDTVHIKASLSDNTLLRKGFVHVHDQLLPVGKDTLFSYEFNVNAKNFELDTICIVNDPVDKNYVIYFDAIDQAENITELLRYFHQYH